MAKKPPIYALSKSVGWVKLGNELSYNLPQRVGVRHLGRDWRTLSKYSWMTLSTEWGLVTRTSALSEYDVVTIEKEADTTLSSCAALEEILILTPALYFGRSQNTIKQIRHSIHCLSPLP